MEHLRTSAITFASGILATEIRSENLNLRRAWGSSGVGAAAGAESIVLSEQAARRSASTVNRMLAAAVSSYESPARLSRAAGPANQRGSYRFRHALGREHVAARLPEEALRRAQPRPLRSSPRSTCRRSKWTITFSAPDGRRRLFAS